MVDLSVSAASLRRKPLTAGAPRYNRFRETAATPGENIMFKRVLLCYDGSQAGRRALKRGAELAVLLGAQVHVLSIIPHGIANAAVTPAPSDMPAWWRSPAGIAKLLDESLEWLKARGVMCEGYLASGDTLDQIVAYAKRLSIDLIVLGHYPQPAGGYLVVECAPACIVGRAGRLLRLRGGQRGQRGLIRVPMPSLRATPNRRGDARR